MMAEIIIVLKDSLFLL